MKRMFRLLKADEIECRISTINEKGLSLLLYKDARVDQNILDETVGPDRWQRDHVLINGNLFCNVSILFDRGDGKTEWVTKQDVGTESYTEKEKGQASDSFKRACFNWGLGRELYTAPFIWINAENYTVKKGPNGKLATYDRFDVTSIRYTDTGVISELEITNTRTGKVVFSFGKKQPAKTESFSPDQKITKKQVLTLRMMCKNHNMPEEKIYGQFGRKNMEEMTIADWVAFGKTGQELLNKWDKSHEDTGNAEAG